MKLRPADLRRTIQRNAARTRDYDTVSTRDFHRTVDRLATTRLHSFQSLVQIGNADV